MWKRAFFQDHAAKFFSAFANVSFGRLEGCVADSLPATFHPLFLFVWFMVGFFAVAENGLLSFQPLLYAFTEK
jgi:hypothetical protein